MDGRQAVYQLNNYIPENPDSRSLRNSKRKSSPAWKQPVKVIFFLSIMVHSLCSVSCENLVKRS